MKKTSFILCFLLLFASQVYAADVAVWGERFSLSVINNFYNGLPDTTSTILTGTLDTNDLSSFELLWAVQPADSYTPAEIAKMASFLAGGGRIAFMGEHGGYAPNENARIAAAIALLGGHITINVDYPDSGYHNATVANGQILSHDLTENVNTYNYACFASLNLSGPAEALMLGSDLVAVMMAYENIGSGSIFLITDQNVWDNVYNYTGNDNAVMFENLLLADTGAPPVPEPGTFVLLVFGLAGVAGLRKQVNRVF